MASQRSWRQLVPSAAQGVHRSVRSAHRRLVPVLGGRTRTRVILVLACVLALSSADTATVGASAIQLHRALHITNTDIGLLVTVTAVVGAVLSLPFGALADRTRRTWLLGGSIALWGGAMIWGAAAGNFTDLLYSRLALGGVTAVAGPVVASLVGDWFPGEERGQIYSYILTGELVGAGAGFAFTGDLAALSWRLAFVVLAIPAFLIAWAVFGLPEPVRGGAGALAPEPGTRPWSAAREAAGSAAATPTGNQPGTAGPGAVEPEEPEPGRTDAQRLALDRGIRPHPRLVDRADPTMGFFTAVRYVLSVRTNVLLIVSGACAYYFLAGVQTFGVEFVTKQYHVAQVTANGLLVVVGLGAVVGVLAAGPLGDALLRRGKLSGRVRVGAIAATAAVVLMLPALLTHSILTALPYVVIATMGLSAQHPVIDAARLDIMPSWLWGRAEGVRTFVRTAAQALAPLLFGVVSDSIFGGGVSGLRWTFLVMLLPLAASAFFLFVAAHRYPRDVATAALAPRAPASRRPQAARHTRGAGHPRGQREPSPSRQQPPATSTRWVGGFGPGRPQPHS